MKCQRDCFVGIMRSIISTKAHKSRSEVPFEKLQATSAVGSRDMGLLRSLIKCPIGTYSCRPTYCSLGVVDITTRFRMPVHQKGQTISN